MLLEDAHDETGFNQRSIEAVPRINFSILFRRTRDHHVLWALSHRRVRLSPAITLPVQIVGKAPLGGATGCAG